MRKHRSRGVENTIGKTVYKTKLDGYFESDDYKFTVAAIKAQDEETERRIRNMQSTISDKMEIDESSCRDNPSNIALPRHSDNLGPRKKYKVAIQVSFFPPENAKLPAPESDIDAMDTTEASLCC